MRIRETSLRYYDDEIRRNEGEKQLGIIMEQEIKRKRGLPQTIMSHTITYLDKHR